MGDALHPLALTCFLLGQSPVVANVSMEWTCAFYFPKHSGLLLDRSRFVSFTTTPWRCNTVTPYKKRTCPLTKRLAEDMMIRNLADATIDAYTYHVRRFADFIQKPLERASVREAFGR